MYAIFISGGKQYKVKKNQTIKLEKLKHTVGEKIQFNNILMISKEKEIIIGNPILKNSTISANVVNHGRNKKINIIKFNRRKHHLKRQGHRQFFTKVLITDIKQY
ncbi:MAG: 50S ribosomal protein L21 [Buchnera aphidicola (Schlechtendalia peitan)]